MVNIDSWIPKYILGYMLYFAFILLVISSATKVNLDIYNLSADQEAILSSQESDIITFLGKVVILSQVNSTIALINIITIILGIIFLLAVAKALKEVIPVLPS